MRLGEILTLVWDHWWCISGFPEFWAAILKNTQYWSWKLTQHWDLSELTGEFGKDTSLILFSPLNPHLTNQNCSVVIFPFGGVLNSVSFALVVNKYCATLHAKGVRSRRVSHIHLKEMGLLSHRQIPEPLFNLVFLSLKCMPLLWGCPHGWDIPGCWVGNWAQVDWCELIWGVWCPLRVTDFWKSSKCSLSLDYLWLPVAHSPVLTSRGAEAMDRIVNALTGSGRRLHQLQGLDLGTSESSREVGGARQPL